MMIEKPIRNIRLEKLIEREKELTCLYKVEALLREESLTTADLFSRLLAIIPTGWQFTSICEVEITFENKVFKTDDFEETEWMLTSDIVVDENLAGSITIAYTQLIRLHRGSQFLPEEQKLLNTIAQRIGDYFFLRKINKTLEYIRTRKEAYVRNNEMPDALNNESNEHWKWRLKMSQKIADSLDFGKFAIEGVYIIGSTKNGEAGPASDIDILIHQNGNIQQQNELRALIKGWSLALAEFNKLKTGYSLPDGIIDLHLIDNEDIKSKNSYAVMIGSLYNSAKPLRIK